MRKFITAFLFLCIAARIFAAEQEELDSALDKAVHDNDVAAARSLLEAGANPNGTSKTVSDGSATFLMLAVGWNGNIQIAELLLNHGANTELRDSDGDSAVYYASNAETLELLADRGARFDVVNNEGKTFLHHESHLRKMDKQLLEELVSKGFNVDEPDIEGVIPLMVAVQERDNEAVTALLEKGADPLRVDNQGNSALSYAIFYSAKYPELKPVRDIMLKSASADDIKTAKATAKKMAAEQRAMAAEERKENTKEHFFEGLATLGVVTPALLYGGLSVWMREGVYANDPSSNFMGSINGMITMGMSGFFLGGGLLGSIVLACTENFAAGIITAIIGAGTGLISGIVLGGLSFREAINTKPALYYATTAVSAITLSVLLFDWFF